MNDIIFGEFIKNPLMSSKPVGEQSEIARLIRDVIRRIGEEKPNATVYQLLSAE